MDEPTEDDLRSLAAQLRRPHGEAGRDVGRRLNEGNTSIYRNAIAHLAPEPGDRILEIGMGPGFFAHDVLALDEGVQYTGADFSELMVSEARKINASAVAAGRANFVLADAHDLPFEDASFDAALTVNTLYFLDPLPEALAELRRVLRPGGRLVVAIRPRHVMRHYPFVKYGFNMFSGDEAHKVLSTSGFNVTDVIEYEEAPRQFGEVTLKVASLIVAGQRT